MWATYGSISTGRGKWPKCGIFLYSLKFFENVFVLVLAHVEPVLELFEVWEIMVTQIVITIIANVNNFKPL